MTVAVGSVELANPVMTASGTAGYGTELAGYLDLSALGAVVVKSLAAYEWAGNPAPRLHPTAARDAQRRRAAGPRRRRTGSTTSCPTCCATGRPSWPRSGGARVDDYARAADLLAAAPPEVVAVEVNLSCPNLDEARTRRDLRPRRRPVGRGRSPPRRRAGDRAGPSSAPTPTASSRSPRPRRAAGAEAVTCINTLLGLAYDPATGRPALGAGGGGLSGPAIHPVAVRAVHDVHAALPDLPIVGVGGVATGWDADELLLAGAVGGAGRHGDVRRPAGTGARARASSPRGPPAEPRDGDIVSPGTPGRIHPREVAFGYRDRMATPPQLTPEQRAAALAKAAEARAARAEIKARLKNELDVARPTRSASDDNNVGKLKVVSLLESLPGVGKVKARKVMEDDRHRRQPSRAGPRLAAAGGAAQTLARVSPAARGDTADHRRVRPRWGRQGNDRRCARRPRSAALAEPDLDDPRPAAGRARRRLRVHRPRRVRAAHRRRAASWSGPSSSATTTARPMPEPARGRRRRARDRGRRRPAGQAAASRRAADLRPAADRVTSRNDGCAGAAIPTTRSLARLRKAEDEEPVGRALADHVVVNDDLEDDDRRDAGDHRASPSRSR